MRALIINGEPRARSDFDRYVASVERELAETECRVSRLDLRDLGIKRCTGCWGCWVMTPGRCVSRDDSEIVCRAVLNCDLALFASPLSMGFTTELMKRAQDKLIPLVHPYIELEGGEMHHRARYAHYPLMGLLLGTDAQSDARDVEITRDIWVRTARNMKTRLAFVMVADRAVEEVVHELAAVA